MKIPQLIFLMILVFCSGCSKKSKSVPPPPPAPVTSQYKVHGTVTGLKGRLEIMFSVTKSDSTNTTKANNDWIDQNGDFLFGEGLSKGDKYSVTTGIQPKNQTCIVKNGSGTVQEKDVTDIEINCSDLKSEPEKHSVGGIVSGLKGDLEIKNDLETLVLSKDGKFSFVTALIKGTEYKVEISKQPANQTCEIKNGSGTIQEKDIVDIEITCKDNAVISPVEPAPVAGPTKTADANGWIELEKGIDYQTVTTIDYDIIDKTINDRFKPTKAKPKPLLPDHITTKVHAFKIDQGGFNLQIKTFAKGQYKVPQALRNDLNARIVVNGGFIPGGDHYVSEGLLVTNGKKISNVSPKKQLSGILTIQNMNLQILERGTFKLPSPIPPDLSMIQAGPLFIDRGGNMGIYSLLADPQGRKERTGICTTTQGEFIILVTDTDQSLYLIELASIGKALGCDIGINLDGGPATSISVQDYSGTFDDGLDISASTGWVHPNLIVVE